MHILVINDDGPPSEQASPYVHSLVISLQQAGHLVSVCLPHTQRSWIGKAHMIGQTVKPTYYRPGSLQKYDGTTHSRPSKDPKQEEWVLVDGTPASCAQIGLYHFFKDRGPIDLVVSGPNYGRNSTSVFALSSGTLGGALEAATCKKRAIAVSYAFESRNHDPLVIAQASKHSARIIEYLHKNWSENVDLYSVNVPLVDGVGKRKILWTHMLQNYWGPRSCFQEVEDGDGDVEVEEEEKKIREGGLAPENGVATSTGTNHSHKHFKWAPFFADVRASVAASEPGNDGWAVQQGYTSVTALKSNYMHVAAGAEELKLPSASGNLKTLSLTKAFTEPISALVDYDDPYIKPLILSALESKMPLGSYTLLPLGTSPSQSSQPFLQITSYESLPFEIIMSHSKTHLANAYAIRKALIRKHYLSSTTYTWITKHPSSILSTHVKPSVSFELDYAEFLDDALIDAWDLQSSFQNNTSKPSSECEWWILKPGMSDRGQGIRLFSTQDELQSIFDEWEADAPDSDSESLPAAEDAGEGDYIMASQLRHFVAQPYIHPPLLLPGADPRKFHIRTYVLAVGSLKVYVYKPMLALFAATAYAPPWSADTPLSAHLTNTCLQSSTSGPSSSSSPAKDDSVAAFWELPLSDAQKNDIFKQICEVTGEIFEAAARGMMVHFQTLPNAFEIFGVDFLVDAAGVAWLLEINAFPDFAQTGEELRGIVKGCWEGVVEKAVLPFFGLGCETEGQGVAEEGMVLVREVDLGRR